jgi:hypothetical protein
MRVVRVDGRNFTSLRAVWGYVVTLADEQRYQALGQLSIQSMRHSAEVDDWAETIYTEVERLRRNTAEWKEKDFQERWRPVRERAHAVRNSKKHIQ